MLKTILFLVVSLAALGSTPVHAQTSRPYLLGAGDIVRISVFQNTDMATEARVADNGTVTFPLVGSIEIAGLTTNQAETRLANALKAGGFVLRPQVSVTVVQFRSKQITVLGYVNRPGRYPIEDQLLRLADVLALAGGITSVASDTVIVTRPKGGKEERLTIDMDAAFVLNDLDKNIEMQPGDTVYVPRFPQFYVYGQVQRPGQFRLERAMTVQQAVALSGGITLRGTEKGISIRRRDVGGKVETLQAGPGDRVLQDDVIFVRESVF